MNTQPTPSLPMLAGSVIAMIAGHASAAGPATPVSMAIESNTIAESNQSIKGLAKMSEKEIVGKFGPPASIRINKSGDVERTWVLTSGQLHVTNHSKGGKVTNVKYFENKTPDQVRNLLKNDML